MSAYGFVTLPFNDHFEPTEPVGVIRVTGTNQFGQTVTEDVLLASKEALAELFGPRPGDN